MEFLSHFAHPHWPNLALLSQMSPVVVIHMLFALAAFLIGLVQLVGPKGTGLHRILGWTWVIMMMTVAVSSFFIHLINPSGFSLIHILSVLTVIMLPIGVYAARRKNIKLHSGIMSRLFIFALVVAGIFTFFPGRLMYQMVFG